MRVSEPLHRVGEIQNEPIAGGAIASEARRENKLRQMKYIIETGNDGGTASVVGWTHDFGSACNEVARIVGTDCYVKIQPINRGKNGAIWNFVHEGKTKWLCVLKMPSAETYGALDGCSPVRDASLYA